MAYRDRIKTYIIDNGITEDFSERTFEQVIEILQAGKTGAALNAVKPTATMRTFIDANPDLYAVALSYPYDQFTKIYIKSDQLIDDKMQSENDESRKGTKRE